MTTKLSEPLLKAVDSCNLDQVKDMLRRDCLGSNSTMMNNNEIVNNYGLGLDVLCKRCFASDKYNAMLEIFNLLLELQTSGKSYDDKVKIYNEYFLEAANHNLFSIADNLILRGATDFETAFRYAVRSSKLVDGKLDTGLAIRLLLAYVKDKKQAILGTLNDLLGDRNIPDRLLKIDWMLELVKTQDVCIKNLLLSSSTIALYPNITSIQCIFIWAACYDDLDLVKHHLSSNSDTETLKIGILGCLKSKEYKCYDTLLEAYRLLNPKPQVLLGLTEWLNKLDLGSSSNLNKVWDKISNDIIQYWIPNPTESLNTVDGVIPGSPLYDLCRSLKPGPGAKLDVKPEPGPGPGAKYDKQVYEELLIQSIKAGRYDVLKLLLENRNF